MPNERAVEEASSKPCPGVTAAAPQQVHYQKPDSRQTVEVMEQPQPFIQGEMVEGEAAQAHVEASIPEGKRTGVGTEQRNRARMDRDFSGEMRNRRVVI